MSLTYNHQGNLLSSQSMERGPVGIWTPNHRLAMQPYP
jgi:hypothetical protein